MGEIHVSPATLPDGEETSGTPLMVPPGAAPAGASRPDQQLDHSYNIYEHHPVPWWVALVWLTFFCFGAGYLILNLAR